MSATSSKCVNLQNTEFGIKKYRHDDHPEIHNASIHKQSCESSSLQYLKCIQLHQRNHRLHDNDLVCNLSQLNRDFKAK